MNILPPSQPPNQNITTKVVRGGAWLYGRILVTGVVNLGVMAILARQLSPAEFGLVALASTALGLLVVIGAEGINEFVIYDNKEGREERVQAAFWMDLAFSTTTALIGLLLVPWIARFYAEPALGPILVALLLRYPIDSLSKIPDALLKKRLDFQKLVIRDTILEILSSLGSVVLALTGWGAWSLVIPSLVVSPMRAIIVLRMARWRPSLAFHFKEWPHIFTYSGNVIGGTLANYVVNNGDNLLIGKLMGSYALGIYNLSWNVSNMVGNNVTGLVNKLALPAFSAVSGDLSHLRMGMSRMLRVLSVATFPLLIGLFVVADDFILTVYGSQWQQAILPLRILIIYALRYSVGSPAGVLFKAVGRTDITFKLGIYTIPFYLVSIWAGSYYGIVGVAVGVTLVRTTVGLISFELVARCLKTSFWKVIEPLVPAFMASCWMGGVVFLAKLLLNALLPESHLLNLVTLITLGGLTYFFLLRTFYHNLALDLVRVTALLLGPLQGYVVKALNAH